MTARQSLASRYMVFAVAGLALVTLATVMTPLVTAQSLVSGDIAGTVTDPSGAIVSSATVNLKNNGTGATQTDKSSATGAYRFALLPPGSYTITVTAPGFQQTPVTTTVSVGQVSTVNVKLTVGSTSQTVEVTSAVPVLQTENANISTNFNEAAVANVPNPGNDLTYIVQTAPGAVMNSQMGYGNTSIYGLPATSNVFTINGELDNDPFFNVNNSGATNLLLGQNDVSEATAVSNGYSGQYGTLGGANVNYVTKSGTNAFHGNLIYYWNGSIMNANDWFNNHSDTPRPFDNANQWAASFGGPIKKGKTFFFLDTEGLRVLLPTSAPVNVPSPQFQAATLANLAMVSPASIPFYQSMFDLYNNAPGVSRAANVLAGGGCGGFTSPMLGSAPCALQYFTTASALTDEWLLTARVDQNIGNNDRAFIHFRTDHGLQASYIDPLNSAFNAVSDQPQYEGQINETHTFSSNAVNQFILAGSWYSAIFAPANLSAATALMPYQLSFAGNAFYPLGNDLSIWPQGRNVSQYQIEDDYSRVMGNHTVKVGVNFFRNDVSDHDPGIGSIGLAGSEDLNSFFNGMGVSYSQSFPTALSNPVASYALDGYIQDEWAVRSNLKITAGLRLEHNSNPVCQNNCFARFDTSFIDTSHDVSQPYNQVLLSGLHTAIPSLQAVGWAPRVGFAWSPYGNGNTVIRGGFGLFYDIFPGQVADFLMRNAPLDNSFTSGPAPLALAVPGNQASLVSGANSSFVNAYSSGGTLASILATNPLFVPPNLYNPDQNIHFPQYQEWSLAVQQAIGRNMSLTLSYVGNHGVHEPVVNGGMNAYCNSVPLPLFPGTPTCTSTLGVASFTGLPANPLDQRFATINEIQSNGISNYNGATVTFTARYSQVQFQVNYTWSHALDDISNGGFLPFNLLTNTSVLTPQNPYNLRQYNYGNSDYDARQALNANYVYTAPHRQGWRNVYGDWTIAGTFFARTGYPFTAMDAADSGILAAYNYNALNFAGSPSLFANNVSLGGTVACGSSATTTPCFNTTQFSPAVAGLGNQRRNQLFGPNYFDTDLTVMRNMKVPRWESGQLSVGLQFFNLLNHPNFDQPNGVLQNPDFGLITHTVGDPTSILGSFLGGDASPRIIQLKAMLTF